MRAARFLRSSSLTIFALLAAAANMASGQSTRTAEVERSDFIRAPEAVAKIGTDLFGDQVNLYTGRTEFSQIDVSLKGNNTLPVSVGRRLPDTLHFWQ